MDAVRLEMMGKLIGKHQRDEIEKFVHEKAGPAHRDFFNRLPDIVDVTADHYTARAPIENRYGQVNKLDANDYYNVMQSGVEVTANEDTPNEWFFYHYVYATSAPYPPWNDYTVIVKSDGKPEIINDLEACSKDALFEDVKRSFLAAKAQLQR